MQFLIAALFWFALSAGAAAGDLESLAREGYGVLDSTTLLGEFKGCDVGLRFPLANGLILVCSAHHFSHVFEPEVLILKNVRTGETKLLIDGEEFEARLFRRPAGGAGG
jgi:hypothetical protein